MLSSSTLLLARSSCAASSSSRTALAAASSSSSSSLVARRAASSSSSQLSNDALLSVAAEGEAPWHSEVASVLDFYAEVVASSSVAEKQAQLKKVFGDEWQAGASTTKIAPVKADAPMADFVNSLAKNAKR